jgi:hypothetical protein
MIVYHELLPEAYLLVLAADPTPGPAPEAELAAPLAEALQRATNNLATALCQVVSLDEAVARLPT